jgi:hypothetical protein
METGSLGPCFETFKWNHKVVHETAKIARDEVFADHRSKTLIVQLLS